MAAIYDMHTGTAITEGLQGCDACDEAIQVAQRTADRLGCSVQLADDDGDWEVFPARKNGTRRRAQQIEVEEWMRVSVQTGSTVRGKVRLKSLTMTTEQTQIYDGRNESATRKLLSALRQQAQQMRSSAKDTVEIYTADGVVADVVQGEVR